MVDVARERRVITAFCERLAVLLREPCVVKEWLAPPNCEAILDRGGIPWAVDHRVLNSFKNQKHDDKIFSEVADALQESLSPLCQQHYVVVLIPVGGLLGDRGDIVRRLHNGVAAQLASIPEDGEFYPVSIENSPTEIKVSREPGEGTYGCYPGRLLPSTHKKELEDDLVEALARKSCQLAAYRTGGRRTALILDTRDISSINEFSVAKAFAAAASRTDHSKLDEVFLFDETSSPYFVWPLKFRGVVPPDNRWICEFRRAQAALIWGWTHKGAPYCRSEL